MKRGVKWSAGMQHPVAEVQQLPHGCTQDDHLLLTLAEQALGESLDDLVVTHRTHGREVEHVAESAVAQLREATSPPDARPRFMVRGRQSGVGCRLARTFEARDVAEFGQHQGCRERSHTWNRDEQVPLPAQFGVLVQVGSDLAFEGLDLGLVGGQNRLKRFPRRSLFHTIEPVARAVAVLLERLQSPRHLAELAQLTGRYLPKQRLLALTEACDQYGVAAIGLRAFELGLAVGFDLARVYD